MRDQERNRTNEAGTSGIGRAFQTSITRRGFLRGATGLGAGALALGVGGRGFVDAAPWRAPTTADQYSADVAMAWFTLSLQLMPSTPGLSPLPAFRTFTYLGITLYESLVGGMPGRESLAGRLNDLASVPGPANRAYHWPSVANSALATAMRELFRMTSEENLMAIDDLESSLEAEMAPGIPFGIAKRSARRGRRVADHILAWAATDGGHDGHLTNFPPDYVPPIGDGLWIPTPPAFLGSYQPFWGTNRTLAISSVEDYDPGPPPEFSTEPGSEFYQSELEVYATVNNLTDEQLSAAMHWANPLGHHQSLIMQAIAANDADLATAAVASVRGGIAASDAIVACFHTKYRYSMIRPVSYIQAYIDENWPNPPVPTPPHPDYTAAHSVVTRAMARAMFDQFGDFTFTDHTWDAVGLPPRTYDTWFGLSEENGLSRLYGGIHSRPAIEVGWDQGEAVGKAVSAVIDQAVG